MRGEKKTVNIGFSEAERKNWVSREMGGGDPDLSYCPARITGQLSCGMHI